MSHANEPIGVIGTGYVGLVTAAGFAELGSEVWCVDIDAEDRAPAARARCRSTSPAWRSCWRATSERLHFSTELAEALEHARLLFVAVGTPPTYSGDADLSAVHAVVAAIPASDGHALVMKSTVPVRHRRGDAARLRRARQGRPGLCLLPRVPQGGLGGGGLPAPRPGGRRRRRRLGGRRGRRAVRAAEARRWCAPTWPARRWSSSPPTPSWRRRSPSSTRSPTSARRRAPTWSRSRAGWAWTIASAPKFLQAGIGFGGSCFPKDVDALKQLAGNSGYHFQLLTAVIEVNELQKRRVIGKLHEHLGGLGGQAHRAARARLQAEHRRHARGLLAGALRPPEGGRRDCQRL